MLTDRRGDILRIVIGEYISTGIPVSSETVVRRGINASSATIRNEMSALEEEGYLAQPHTSAGRIPSDEGYRWYVDSIMKKVYLATPEQRLIAHQFHQVESEAEEWTRLAASILSRMLRNVAIVTLPKPAEPQLQHIELISVNELLVMLVILLKEAKLKQQAIMLEEPVSQEDLNNCARKLESIYSGRPSIKINTRQPGLSPLEERIGNAVSHIMQAEGEGEFEEPIVDGLRHILNQTEYMSSHRISALVGMLEQKSLLKSLLPRLITGHGIQVMVGEENKEDALRDCSLVITKYGIPGEVSGAVGIVGPTRMHYDIAIPTVDFISKVMSRLVNEAYR